MAETSSEFSHAFANLLKTMIGSGLLTLPYVTGQAGVGLSLSGLMLLAYLTQVAIRMVVRCAAHERQLQNATYVDLDQGPATKPSAEDHGSSSWQLVSKAAFGPVGWFVTSLSLLTAQLGVASSYLDLVGNTIMDHAHVSTYTSRLILWVAIGALCMLRQLKNVAYLSMAALLVYSVIIVLVAVFGAKAWMAREDGWFGESDPVIWFDASQLGTWFGPSLFAFEGMGTALSIYESMGATDPKPFFGVISAAYSVAVVIYVFVAGFGYLAWRAETGSVILENFPHTAIGYGARLMLAAVLALTYPIQMTPVFQIAERACPSMWPITRLSLVGFTCFASYTIPDMGKMVGLTGALAFSSIGFVLPGLFYLLLRPPSKDAATDVALAVSLVVLGLVGGVWGVYSELH